jgi:hypothetical protein
MLTDGQLKRPNLIGWEVRDTLLKSFVEVETFPRQKVDCISLNPSKQRQKLTCIENVLSKPSLLCGNTQNENALNKYFFCAGSHFHEQRPS